MEDEEKQEGGEGYVSPLIRAVLNYRNGLTEVYEGPAADNLIKTLVVGKMALASYEQQQQTMKEIVQEAPEPVKAADFRTAVQKYIKTVK